MKVEIQCSSCGHISRFPYRAENVIERVRQGWNSFGGVLYCPDCAKIWKERIKDGKEQRQLAGAKNTIRVIDHMM